MTCEPIEGLFAAPWPRNIPAPPLPEKLLTAVQSSLYPMPKVAAVALDETGANEDILKADEHLALNPDFSNIDDVLAQFRDPQRRQSILDAAFELVRTEHTYDRRVQQVFELLAAAS
jgi:hypothetical protein